MKKTIADLLTDVKAKGFWEYGTDRYTGAKCGHDMTAEDIADYLLENGVTVQKWIPVTERLPEDENAYLVVVEYKYSYEKELSRDVDVAIHRFDDGYIDSRWDTFNDWDEGQQHLRVTHWMPLPELPKGE